MNNDVSYATNEHRRSFNIKDGTITSKKMGQSFDISRALCDKGRMHGTHGRVPRPENNTTPLAPYDAHVGGSAL